VHGVSEPRGDALGGPGGGHTLSVPWSWIIMDPWMGCGWLGEGFEASNSVVIEPLKMITIEHDDVT